MSTIAMINKAKEEVAKQILEDIDNMFNAHNDFEEFYFAIGKKIEKEYLFKSDYTK